MSKRMIALVVAVVLLLAGLGLAWGFRPVPVNMVVDVTGTAGLAVKGTTEVDGVKTPVAGTVPWHFTLRGDSVSIALDSDAPAGEFVVNAATDFGPYHATSTAKANAHAPDDVVHAISRSGWGWEMPDFGINSGNEKAHAKSPR